jgi:hypothetical protein
MPRNEIRMQSTKLILNRLILEPNHANVPVVELCQRNINVEEATLRRRSYQSISSSYCPNYAGSTLDFSFDKFVKAEIGLLVVRVRKQRHHWLFESEKFPLLPRRSGNLKWN